MANKQTDRLTEKNYFISGNIDHTCIQCQFRTNLNFTTCRQDSKFCTKIFHFSPVDILSQDTSSVLLLSYFFKIRKY